MKENKKKKSTIIVTGKSLSLIKEDAELYKIGYRFMKNIANFALKELIREFVTLLLKIFVKKKIILFLVKLLLILVLLEIFIIFKKFK